MSEYVKLPGSDYAQALEILEGITLCDDLPEGCFAGLMKAVLLLKNDVSKINISQSVGQSTNSMSETVKRVKKQISAEAIESPLVESICGIIAETYIRSHRGGGNKREMKIQGSYVDVRIVADAYAKLTREHVMFVVNNFKNASSTILNQTMYLQTALYNAAFEFVRVFPCKDA